MATCSAAGHSHPASRLKRFASVTSMPGIRLAVLLALVAPLYLFLGWNADIGESGTDGPAYLMMAEHFSGHGLAGAAHDLAATTSRFPPVYPLLLALAGGATDLLHAHLLTVACLLAALAAMYAWLQPQGLPPTVSLLLVVAIALAPGSWLLALVLQSEYLYLAWSLLALALMAAGERGRRAEYFHLAALAVALAALTRTVGVILLVPLLICQRRQPRTQALLSMVIAMLPVLLWKAVHHSRLGYDQAIAALYHETGLGGFVLRLPGQWLALRNGIEENLLRQAVFRPLADLLGLLGAIAALLRLRRLQPDAIYLALYTGVILLWPFPEEGRRFTWVILPLLLTQPLLLVAQAGRVPDARRPLIAIAWLLAIASMAVPAALFGLDRWRAAGQEDFAEARYYALWYSIDTTGVRRDIERDLAFKGAMRAIPDAVPESDCVITTRPDIVVYFGRRVSLLPPAEALPESSFRASMQQLGCHYVFGLFGVSVLYPTPLYPVGRVADVSEPLFVSTLPGMSPGSTEDVAALVRLK